MGIKTPTPPSDESMILPSLTWSALMETTCQDETERVSSGAWLMKLKNEIDEPDQPHPSIFDNDNDLVGIDRQSSDKSREYAIAHVGASESAAGAADTHRVRLTSTATTFSAVELIPFVDILDREQSREVPYRESSLLVAANVVVPHERGPATLDATTSVTGTAATDEEQASRKRKVTSNKPVKSRKRALEEPLTQRAPSRKYRYVGKEDIRDDDILKGRGGLSNHHVGNRKFRKIIADMKGTYKKMHLKTDKTALSRGIVEYIQAKGGRFLIKTTNGQVRWRVMTKEESQKKTSQALRETKKVKWTL
ncbi:hypothetical protein MHU86_6372 [Fragilaria crotonensis]|nr:hypothetical protein MHU86_6372 [Fragilaria crotonensis]